MWLHFGVEVFALEKFASKRGMRGQEEGGGSMSGKGMYMWPRAVDWKCLHSVGIYGQADVEIAKIPGHLSFNIRTLTVAFIHQNQ